MKRKDLTLLKLFLGGFVISPDGDIQKTLSHHLILLQLPIIAPWAKEM